MGTSSNRSSLVRRLSLRAALWALALGLTLVTVAVWHFWRVSLQTFDAALVADARTLAGYISPAPDGLDIAIPDELTALLENEQTYYAIFDARGQRLDGSAPNPPEGPPSLVRTAGGFREVTLDSVRGARVVVGRWMGALVVEVRQLAISLLAASLLVIVLAAPLTLWLRRQLADPLAHIDQTARALTSGKAARLDTTRVDDEFVGVARALNDAFDGLEAALARERQLTSDVSHELRTPVATLVAETAWALTSPRTADEYRNSLEVCARQARRMKDLTDSLLTLARIEAGTHTLRRESVDLHDMACEATADLLPLARARGISLRLEGHATIVGDAVQLRTLFSNLVSNAIRYNRRNGDVIVRLWSGSRRVHLEVEDTGNGIDPDHATRLFSRFWRADASRSGRDGGSGLGLAISNAVVAAHGGTIGCRPAARQGTIFTVELPDGHDASLSADAGAPPAACRAAEARDELGRLALHLDPAAGPVKSSRV